MFFESHRLATKALESHDCRNVSHNLVFCYLMRHKSEVSKLLYAYSHSILSPDFVILEKIHGENQSHTIR